MAEKIPKITNNKQYYLCTNCGFSEHNRADWCAIGCGNDYNKMIEIKYLPEFINKIKQKYYRQGKSDALNIGKHKG